MPFLLALVCGISVVFAAGLISWIIGTMIEPNSPADEQLIAGIQVMSGAFVVVLSVALVGWITYAISNGIFDRLSK